MEFKNTYNLDGVACEVIIGYHEEHLDYVKITKDQDHLEHYYRDEELVGCTLNHHDIPTNDGLINGNVAGSEYQDGVLLVDGETGAFHIGDTQLISGTGDVYLRGHYVGRFISGNDKSLDNSSPLLSIFDVSNIRDEIRIHVKYRDSEDILFLLGFGSSFPYYPVLNLPAIGLDEMIHAFSHLFKEGVYLKYMKKLFGTRIKEVIFTIDYDPGVGNRVLARLYNCDMMMMIGDNGRVPYSASIIDADGLIHDFYLSSSDANKYHEEVKNHLPHLA